MNRKVRTNVWPISEVASLRLLADRRDEGEGDAKADREFCPGQLAASPTMMLHHMRKRGFGEEMS